MYKPNNFLTASCSFLAWLTLQSTRWRRHVLPKCLLIVTGIQAIVFQRIGVFINCRSVMKIGRAIFEDIAILFLGHI
jgi:hypothetical protein